MTCKIERIFSGERPYQNMEQSEYVSFNDLNDKPVAIYGLGECSHWFHEIAMKRLGLSPVVALDRNPQTQSWWESKQRHQKFLPPLQIFRPHDYTSL